VTEEASQPVEEVKQEEEPKEVGILDKEEEVTELDKAGDEE
jgi:hypothetical protein